LIRSEGGSGEIDRGSGVFVVIAAFNEEAVLEEVVREVLTADQRLSLVVVDDASTDRTLEIAGRLPVQVLHHSVNLGQGAALQTGIDFALGHGAEAIVTFDADGQMTASDIPDVLSPVILGRCDVALGSRFGNLEPSGMTHSRRMLLRTAVRLTRIVSGLALNDVHNGLRALNRDAAERIRIRQNRMAHASEILNQIARLGLRWEEVPVSIRYSAYSKGKGQSSLGALDIVLDLLRSPMR
jgi:glycosyltransferase involved in cell wall biosynthesis